MCALALLSKTLKRFFSVFYIYDFLNVACKIKKTKWDSDSIPTALSSVLLSLVRKPKGIDV